MRFPVVLLLCCTIPALALAEDKPLPKKGEKGVVPAKEDDWTGKSAIITKKPMKDLRFGKWIDGKQVFATPGDLVCCDVLEDRDGYLRVCDSGVEGWALKQDFLLPEAAPNYWAEARKAKPNDPFAIFMHGFSDARRGDDSLADMTEAIRLDPMNMVFFANRGIMRAMVRKDFEKSVEDFTEAIRLDPKIAGNYVGRGCSYEMMNEHRKAIADMTEAIRLNPGYVNAYVNRGGAWIFESEFEKAIADSNEAIRLDPKNHDAYVNRSMMWTCQTKEFGKALADLNEAIRLDPKDSLALANRGSVLLELKKHDNALADVDAALKLEPKNNMALLTKARIHSRMGKYTEAHIAFGEAIAFAPCAEFYNNAAWFYATCAKDIFRDGKQALEYSVQARKYHAKGPSYWKSLAAAYAETGQFDLAIAEQTKVIEKLNSAKKPDADELKKAKGILKCYQTKKPYRDVNE